MKYFVLILLMGSLAIFRAQVPGDCNDLLMDYSDFVETDSTIWQIELKDAATIATLMYYGASHSKDISHPQFQEIVDKWNSDKFDIALFEGPNRGILSTKEETIANLGESGYVRYLANEKNIPVSTLEPSPISEIEYLSTLFPIDQIKLFFLLREAQRVRETLGMDKDQIIDYMEKLLVKANAIPQLENTITTISGLEKAYIKYWGDKGEWWQAPSAWFTPSGNSLETGGIFTNEINKFSSEFRNLHMVQLISSLLSEGKKIFAVVGRNHVPMQADALACEWGKLISISNDGN
ncbi:MAG: hypothetical protein RIB64_23725 [Arenibacter algicola]